MRFKRSYRLSDDSRPLLYDARGMRVKASPLSNKWIRALLFYVLPYLVINGIIFILVCSRPSITIDIGETTDYVSSEVAFTVHSILPLRDVNVTLESQPIQYTRSGNTYTCRIDQNGTFMVQVTSVNGMQRKEFEDIALLDSSAPSIDAQSATVNNGTLTFMVSDNQSGVDYDSVYAVTDQGEHLLPSEMDESQGIVTIDIPVDTLSLELYYADMVGNEGSGHIDLVSGE